MSRLSLYIPLVVFALIVLLGYLGFSITDRNTLPSALLGKPFPQVSGPDLLQPQQQVATKDFLGRVVMVNVWATWCPTCKAEHEELMRIAGIADLDIVGVNYKDNRAKALRWLTDYGNPYKAVLMDLDGSVGVELGVYGAPETFLLNRRGEVVYKRIGDINTRVWEAEFVPRLQALEVEVREQPSVSQQTAASSIIATGAGQ